MRNIKLIFTIIFFLCIYIYIFLLYSSSAHLISKYRPNCPIIGVTRNEIAARQMHLWRGLFPVLINEPKKLELVAGDAWIQDVENRVQKALDIAEIQGFIRRGDNIVVVTGWRGVIILLLFFLT